jgi:NTE family protein
MSDHQADGVIQGGGVKGLGLVGALLEFADQAEHPDHYVDEWVNLAGTSAGAIIAAYLATGHDAGDTRTLVEGAPYHDFQDWGPGGEVIGGGLNLLRVHGLAHGALFHEWFDAAIERKTFGELPPGKTLKLIAADLTRREMLVLPDALADYRAAGGDGPIDPTAFKIADAVRMSMSIPYFFQPIGLVHHESGKQSTIVDGGVLSNFPVWLFDAEQPQRPTFGFRLIGGKDVGGPLQRVLHTLGWAAEMGADLFHTATEAWDKHFVEASTAVRTCTVDAGSVGTTDFDLGKPARDGLLQSGHDGARAFLAAWDPGAYVNRLGRSL